MMKLLILLLLLTAQQSSATGDCDTQLVESDFALRASFGAYGGKKRTITVDSNGQLIERVSHPILMLQSREDLSSHRCLKAHEMDTLVDAVRRSGFLGLPDDLSSPPYYVHEALAVLKITRAGETNQVRAAGLERATELEALCFRELWEWILALSVEPIDPLGEVPGPAEMPPNKSLERTPGLSPCRRSTPGR